MNTSRTNFHSDLPDAFAAALFSLSASQGERAGVRSLPTGVPEFKPLEKEIKISWLK